VTTAGNRGWGLIFVVAAFDDDDDILWKNVGLTVGQAEPSVVVHQSVEGLHNMSVQVINLPVGNLETLLLARVP